MIGHPQKTRLRFEIRYRTDLKRSSSLKAPSEIPAHSERCHIRRNYAAWNNISAHTREITDIRVYWNRHYIDTEEQAILCVSGQERELGQHETQRRAMTL